MIKFPSIQVLIRAGKLQNCVLQFKKAWKQKYKLQLQVCCNVTSAKMWPLDFSDNWTLGAAVFEENKTYIHKDMWADLQVTVCDDKPEPSLGYAEARNGAKCKHYRGQTFNIRPSEFFFFFELNGNLSGCWSTNPDIPLIVLSESQRQLCSAVFCSYSNGML